MISTLLPRTATGIAMERQSVTAPDYRSVHGTGLPFAAAAVMTAVTNGTDVLTAKTRVAAQADAPGSPPRGRPV